MMPDISDPLNRILVVRTDRIGDVLLSTPVLSAIRERYPDCFLAMMVRPYTREVVTGHPALDMVIEDDASGVHYGLAGLFRLAGLLKVQSFDAVIILHPTLRLALLGKLAGIPIRIGSGYRAYSMLFTHKVFEHRKDARHHELSYNLNMIQDLGISEPNAVPEMHITEAAQQAIDGRLNTWQIRPDAPLIVLHPGSGGSARDWPARYFAELADRLAEEEIGRVVLTGGPQEEELIHSVTNDMKTDPITLVGQTSIKEMAALLARSSLCVANSTGPMHLAATVGTPTVALFCPITPCSPTRWGPYGEGHIVIQPEVPACPGCIETACPYYDCMTRISVESVFQASKQILQSVNEP